MTDRIKNITDHAEVSEKAIEAYLARRVSGMGGLCLKFSSMTRTGYPDRVVLMPGGVTFWVELKSRGRKPTKMQRLRLEGLKAIGHHAYVADSKEAVDTIIAAETEGGLPR